MDQNKQYELEDLINDGFIQINNCECEDCTHLNKYPVLTKNGKTYIYAWKTKRLFCTTKN